jgi:hypothetical protein
MSLQFLACGGLFESNYSLAYVVDSRHTAGAPN